MSLSWLKTRLSKYRNLVICTLLGCLLCLLPSCLSTAEDSPKAASELSQASEPPQASTPPQVSEWPQSREKFLWPFSKTSPWNMPIGSQAEFKPANIKPSPRLRVDPEHFFQLKANDPKRPVYAPGSWKKRCSGKKKSMGISLPVPDNLIIPDATKKQTPNNASAFLLPNGKTLVQLEPLARCEVGGPIYGHRYPDVNIYGKGIGGAHFGSGLSSIGGSIRRGELIGDQPIRHALKINLWAKKYLYYSKDNPGYRWPADRADKYASKQKYGGKNPELVMGSLLAIPPDITEESLNLQTRPAKKIFYALQNYGAYVVDDTVWDAHAIPLEDGILGEFRKTYGYPFQQSKKKGGPFYKDMMKLFSSLHIVVNNGPENIGGGGQPRLPLAPPIAD